MPTDPSISSMPERGRYNSPDVFSSGSRSLPTPAQRRRSGQSGLIRPDRQSCLRRRSETHSESHRPAHPRNSVSGERMCSRHGLCLAADRTGARKDDRRSPPIAPGRTGESYRRFAQGFVSCQSPGDGRVEGRHQESMSEAGIRENRLAIAAAGRCSRVPPLD